MRNDSRGLDSTKGTAVEPEEVEAHLDADQVFRTKREKQIAKKIRQINGRIRDLRAEKRQLHEALKAIRDQSTRS